MSAGTDLISVIVDRASGSAEELRATIRSVLEQPYPCEVVVVGAPSLASTDEWTIEGPTLRWCAADANDAGTALKAGLASVRGEIVGVLAAGDLFLPGSLRLAAEAMRLDPGASIAYSAGHRLDGEGRVVGEVSPPPPFDLTRFLLRPSSIPTSGSFLRRSVAEAVGGANVGCPAPHLDLWLRMVLEAPATPVEQVLFAAPVLSRPRDQSRAAYLAHREVLRSSEALRWAPRRLARIARAGGYLVAQEHSPGSPLRRTAELVRAILIQPNAARAISRPRMLVPVSDRWWQRAARVRRAARRGLDGSSLRRQSRAADRSSGSYDPTTLLPPGAASELVEDNPRLTALRRRYAALDSPRCRHSFWSEDYRQNDLDLPWFRGDNIYVWQLRNVPDLTRLRYALYLRYIADIDERGLLSSLQEDGLFGCWTFTTTGYPVASRDLLDSINELHFLQRMCGAFDREHLRVLDIGAGYGRLAHRAAEGLPKLDRWYCTDGVPESTFLCEWYLRFRRCDDRAVVVPADEVGLLPVGSIDLAVNVHSFSEMALESIAAWADELSRLRIPRLLIVPNDPDRLVSYESDRRRLDVLPTLAERGYVLRHVEPIISPPHLQRMIGIPDRFWWFEAADRTA